MSSIIRQVAGRRGNGLVNCRWRSSKVNSKFYNITKRNIFLKLVGIGGIGGIGIGGTIIYANYDRVFKFRVNQTIPGFSDVADKAGETWKKTRNYFRRPQKVAEKEKENSSLVYQPSKAKPKPDLEKILKGESSLPRDKDNWEKLFEEESTNKPTESGEGKANTPKGADSEVKSTSDSNKAAVKVSPEVSDSMPNVTTTSESDLRQIADSKTQTEEVSDSDTGLVDGGDNDMRSSEQPDATEVSSKEVPESRKEKNIPVQVSGVESSSSSMKGVVPGESSSITIEESSSAVTEEITTSTTGVKSTSEKEHTPAVVSAPEPLVEKDSKSADPSESVEQLEEAYVKFLDDCSRVSAAQQQVKEAWQDLYAKVAVPTDVEGGVEQQIFEAKQASTKASNNLNKAMDSYTKSSSYLEKLAKNARVAGYTARASTVTAEMQSEMAEIDLGLILVKEVVATSSVAAGYHAVIGRSKEELRMELEGVSSSIDPANKDGLIVSLSKKLQVLEQKLKRVDTEYARNMMIALEVQKSELDELGEKKLEYSLKGSEAKHKITLTNAINKEAAKYHAAVIEQMRVAHESYCEEKDKALKKLGEDLSVWWRSQLDQKLCRQAAAYQFNLAKAHSRLAGVERMVDSVADAGERTIKFHNFRRCCDSLVGNLERINSDPDYDVQRYVLETDLNSFREAAHDDPFIVAALDSIPSQAIQGAGIQSEQQLKTRFEKVRRTCRGVALVPPEGAGPLTYLLSHIQSMLTFRRTPLPDVIDYPELDKMDTYAILHLAEKRMKTGDLEGVVDCMAYLKGEPKITARDWLEDARLYLETRQAIALLQTYMRAKTFLKR